MSQKFILMLALSLTAFVLVIGGALVGWSLHPVDSAASPTASEIQQVYAQREQEYQARLAEANRALTAAYAAENSPPPSGQVKIAQPTAPSANITSSEAMLVAALSAPGAKIYSMPELVNLQGRLAYEVNFDQGVVYVDAQNGAILFNNIHFVFHEAEHEDDD
jgi:uncharacterized membrane protein YkoI